MLFFIFSRNKEEIQISVASKPVYTAGMIAFNFKLSRGRKMQQEIIITQEIGKAIKIIKLEVFTQTTTSYSDE